MKPCMVRVARSLAVGGVVLASAACTVTVDSGRFSTRVEKRWTVSGTPDITLVTFDGSVEVRSWDRAEVRVEIEKQAVDKERADAIDVQAEQAGDTIRVEAKKPPSVESMFGLNVSPSARMIAFVPRRCNVVVNTGDGSIRLERIEGRIELVTGDGSLAGSELSGSLKAHTGDGGIRFEDIRGDADLDTGDGAGTLTGALGRVRLRTGDGSLTVRAEDGSGMTDDWEIRTGDGCVRVDLPERFEASLDADTGDGTIRVSGFGEPTGVERDHEDRSALRRPIGPGGHLLRLRTGSGCIAVKRL